VAALDQAPCQVCQQGSRRRSGRHGHGCPGGGSSPPPRCAHQPDRGTRRPHPLRRARGRPSHRGIGDLDPQVGVRKQQNPLPEAAAGDPAAQNGIGGWLRGEQLCRPVQVMVGGMQTLDDGELAPVARTSASGRRKPVERWLVSPHPASRPRPCWEQSVLSDTRPGPPLCRPRAAHSPPTGRPAALAVLRLLADCLCDLL
jgi:hypothetical protein